MTLVSRAEGLAALERASKREKITTAGHTIVMRPREVLMQEVAAEATVEVAAVVEEEVLAVEEFEVEEEEAPLPVNPIQQQRFYGYPMLPIC